jgi:hypothetical protein
MPLSEGEQNLIKRLDILYKEGSEFRSKNSKGWESAIKTIRGETWPEKRPKYKVDAVMNFLAQIVERKAALLTDSRPTITVSSNKQQDDDVAKILQKTIEGILDERNFEQKITEFVMLEEYFGFALFNTCYDKNLNYGKGDLDLVVIDPRCFIFDPFVTRSWNLQYGEYCCLDTIKPTEMLKDLNPKKADLIKTDFTSEDIRPDSLVHKLRALMGWEKTSTEKTSAIPRSIVRDWWIRDRTNKKDGKLIFPNWRHIIIAGGCPVEDGANPYLDGNNPFDGMEWGFNVDSPYGFNEIGTLQSPQILFNKLLAGIMENAILMGNNIWIGDRNALTEDDWKKLSNEPGSHVRLREGKNLRREPAPPLPNYVMPLATMLINGLEKLSGITEVTEGRRPGQVTSGTAIECVDFETECLTKRGWKHVYELEPEDKIYCMDEETELGIWSPLLRVNVQEKYEGPMWEIKNKQIDALVTPNHEWLVGSTSVTGRFREGKYKRVKTTELNTNHWIPSAAKLDEKEVGGICSPHIMEFLGWLVTEGCITHKYSADRKGNPYAYEYPEVKLSQSMKENPEKCELIEKCLSACKFSYRSLVRADGVKVWTLLTKDSQLIKDMFPDKRPGYQELTTTKPSLLRVLYETMLKGDGTGVDREEADTVSVVFSTSDRELADQFQMLATLLGVPTAMNITPEEEGAKHKKDCYKDKIKITCKQTSQISVRNMLDHQEIKEVLFSGPIWCPTTITGNWFLRRNGTVIVSRNSLAMMAQTTIRLKARQLEGMLQRIGQKLIPRIFAYYTTDRVFNLVGPKGKIEKYYFQREKIREVISKGGMNAFQDYQFKVIPASSLAMTKWQKGLMAVQLFQTGLIDEEAALDALEFPNRDEIMERMAEKQKEMAMIAAQTGQKPPRGFGGKKGGMKMPANLLRGKKQELGMQEPQVS